MKFHPKNIFTDKKDYFQARGNAILQASLERRKQALHERRLALEQDVSFTSSLLNSRICLLVEPIFKPNQLIRI
jgi:hypothetical protein